MNTLKAEKLGNKANVTTRPRDATSGDMKEDATTTTKTGKMKTATTKRASTWQPDSDGTDRKEKVQTGITKKVRRAMGAHKRQRWRDTTVSEPEAKNR